MQYKVRNTEIEMGSVPDTYSKSVEEYSEILNCYNLSFREIDCYLQVGEIEWASGWVLSTSVIQIQIVGLLDVIIPDLISDRIPFRIVKSKTIAKMMSRIQPHHLLRGVVPNFQQLLH